MRDLPGWVIQVIAELDRYDHEHPKLYAQYAGSSDYLAADCPCHLLQLVPAEERAYARGWLAGADRVTEPPQPTVTVASDQETRT